MPQREAVSCPPSLEYLPLLYHTVLEMKLVWRAEERERVGDCVCVCVCVQVNTIPALVDMYRQFEPGTVLSTYPPSKQNEISDIKEVILSTYQKEESNDPFTQTQENLKQIDNERGLKREYNIVSINYFIDHIYHIYTVPHETHHQHKVIVHCPIMQYPHELQQQHSYIHYDKHTLNTKYGVHKIC